MFGPKNLSSILSGFRKTQAQLNGLIERNNETLKRNSVQVQQLYAERTLLNSENAKAETVKANIAKFIGE